MIDDTVIILLLASTIRLATPLLLAAMGELVSERAGVLNLSVEGMMLTGAFFGAWGCFASGNATLGLLAGIAAALAVGALQAVLTVRLQADQVVSGIGINLFALGLTTLLSRIVFGSRSLTQLPGFDVLRIPILAELPLVGIPLFQQTPMVYLAFAGVLCTWVLLSKTGCGLAITAAGSDPMAADRTGIPVLRVRAGAILYTSALCGTAGAFYSLADIKTFVEGMTSGTGFIALVAVIFGKWRVLGVALACLFFGGTIALRFFLPAVGVGIPLALLAALPYVAALIAVTGIIGRQKQPGALAVPYRAQR